MAPSLATGVIVGVFALYLGVLGSHFVSLLYPTLLLDGEAAARNGVFEPAWGDPTAFWVAAHVRVPGAPLSVPVWERVRAVHGNNAFSLTRTVDLSVLVPELALNKSAFLMVSLAKAKDTKKAGDDSHEKPIHLSIPVTTFRKPKPVVVKRRLVEGWPILGGLFPPSKPVVHHPPASAHATNKNVGYLLPRVTIRLVADWTRWPRPPRSPFEEYEHSHHHLHASATSPVVRSLVFDADHRTKYLPLISTVQTGLRHSDLVQINASVEHNVLTNLTVELSEMPLPTFMFYQLMEDAIRQHRELGLAEESDLDEMRMLFTGTSPPLLALTIIISLVHFLFDTLAFKTEIGFWRRMDTAHGISLSSLGLNYLSQVIIMLYLHDQESSLLVLGPVGFGLGVGLWKLLKAAWLKRPSRAPSSTASATETAGSPAAELHADRVAVRYMSVVVMPLACAYALLTLVRDDHASWYSWLISSLAACVYAFGFVLLTPQVYLNYKLKSVAHLDLMSLTYRAFNTFIDDFFAFLIPMPGMHRMAVFRDDVVFLVFLYQRWIYPVRGPPPPDDMTKKNE